MPNFQAIKISIEWYNTKNRNISFEYPNKSLLKSRYPQKNPEIQKSQTLKNPSIIPVTWNQEYPPGAPGSSGPLNHLYIPSLTEKVFLSLPSIDKYYPFHTPSLELCISFNCCKCTGLLNMKYITKPENFLDFLTAQDPFVAFLGILQTGMRFPYPFIVIISLACISCETHNL